MHCLEVELTRTFQSDFVGALAERKDFCLALLLRYLYAPLLILSFSLGDFYLRFQSFSHFLIDYVPDPGAKSHILSMLLNIKNSLLGQKLAPVPCGSTLSTQLAGGQSHGLRAASIHSCPCFSSVRWSLWVSFLGKLVSSLQLTKVQECNTVLKKRFTKNSQRGILNVKRVICMVMPSSKGGEHGEGHHFRSLMRLTSFVSLLITTSVASIMKPRWMLKP